MSEIAKRNGHTCTGNCWHDSVSRECKRCGADNLCDVCHTHCMPRGECDECPECIACYLLHSGVLGEEPCTTSSQ